MPTKIEWTDMMGIEIAARVISAMRARKFVSTKYVVSPALEFGRSAEASPLNSLSVNVSWRVFPARGALSHRRADLNLRFNRMTFAPAIRVAASGLAHRRSCLSSVSSPLESRRAAFRRFPVRYAVAQEAFSSAPISACGVDAEHLGGLPPPAFEAVLLPAGYPSLIVAQRQPEPFRCDFFNPNSRSHDLEDTTNG